MGKTGGWALMVLGWLALSSPAWAAQGATQPPVARVTGPQVVSQLNATLNDLIGRINAILLPLIPQTPGLIAPANFITLMPGLSEVPATIQLQGGADTADLRLSPDAGGDVILFTPSASGVLRFANVASFAPAGGLSACPGTVPGKAGLNMAGRVTGHFIVKDWLGRSHGIPSC